MKKFALAALLASSLFAISQAASAATGADCQNYMKCDGKQCVPVQICEGDMFAN